MRYLWTVWETLRVCALAALPVFLLFQVATAQSKNSFQEMQPAPGNFLARSGESCPDCSYAGNANALDRWQMDEASGNIVSEVNTISLTASGDPTYNQTITGCFAGVTPAIDFDGNDSFSNESAQSDLDLGTGDATLWAKAKLSSSAGPGLYTIFSTIDTGAETVYGYTLSVGNTWAATSIFAMMNSETDATEWQYGAVTPSSLADDEFHVLKVRIDRDGNATFYLDGSLVDTSDVSGMETKSVTAHRVDVGYSSTFPGGAYWLGEIAEWGVSDSLTYGPGCE